MSIESEGNAFENPLKSFNSFEKNPFLKGLKVIL